METQNDLTEPIIVEVMRYLHPAYKNSTNATVIEEFLRSPPCEVSIVSEQSLSIIKWRDKDGEEHADPIDLFVKPGDPPKLYVTFLFLGRCLLINKTDIKTFKDRLHRAVDRFPSMKRSLSNNVNPGLALILRTSERKWLRTKLDVVDDLADDTFHITYTAKIVEKISGVEMTVSGEKKEIEEEIRKGKHRLSQIVQGSEEISNFRELLKNMKANTDSLKITGKADVEKITLTSREDGHLREIVEYKGDNK